MKLSGRQVGRVLSLLMGVCMMFSLFGCGKPFQVLDGDGMVLKIDGKEYPVEWEDNETVEALKDLCPLTVKMSIYGGFEQVGPLGSSLPRNDEQTTTDYGDIVLYSGDQIVIFYGSNSWAYTRLGHISADKKIMEEALGNGDVTIELGIR